jgi:hypothetical protein
VRKVIVQLWVSAIYGGVLMVGAGVSLAQAQTQTINVSTVAELHQAVSTANSAGGNRLISIADGTYTLQDTLYINAPNVTLAGRSGDRTKVIIQGDAMSSNARVGNLIRAAASGFELRNITLQKSKYHLIQVVGENNADAPVIRDCIMRDAYQQMLKVTLDPANPSVTSDKGLVENCVFEYSAGIGPQYYIGGIDAHGAKDWVVRGNTFRNIASPSGSVAEFAIHFWNGSRNNIVERNLIVNSDRGIGFGMDGRGNTGGIIRNNMIYHANNGHAYADTGIALIESPGTSVYNNTIYFENSFPWSIEYRFSSTTGVMIANNLSNRPIQARDGASGTISKNVTNASGSWFVNRSSGDLHLASSVANVVDAGQTISGLTNDFDGQSRPQGSGIDIGADEFGSTQTQTTPMPPTNVRVEN